jgi:hypothetical protein
MTNLRNPSAANDKDGERTHEEYVGGAVAGRRRRSNIIRIHSTATYNRHFVKRRRTDRLAIGLQVCAR